MAKYIDSEKAIDACFNGWNNNAHDCAENIRSIPAADVVERKVGKWLKVNGYAIALTSDDEEITMPIHKCSACGESSLNVFYTNYCPNCGAKMIGGDDDV